MASTTRIPGFRGICLTIGVAYVLMGGSILVRGVPTSMAPFGLPAETLASPHYLDAMWWVYTHTVVLGALIAALGWLGEGARLQRGFARLLLVAQIHYLWLDVRTSDSALGNGLYQGPESLIPVFIGATVTLAFAWLSFAPVREVAPAG